MHLTFSNDELLCSFMTQHTFECLKVKLNTEEVLPPSARGPGALQEMTPFDRSFLLGLVMTEW